MATSDEIRGQIEAARQRLELDRDAKVRAKEELAAARERQQLRRQLDALNEQIVNERRETRFSNLTRDAIDQDRSGDTGTPGDLTRPVPQSLDKKALRQNLADCGSSVSEGELEWTINGMSWLANAMKRAGTSEVKSPELSVGGSRFMLVYNPYRDVVNYCPNPECGSLVLRHLDKGDLIMRHSFYIKGGADDAFHQWGETTEEGFAISDTEGWIFGPDVTVDHCGEENFHSEGIFGLTHDAITASGWVHNDSLTVRLKVELLASTPKRRAIPVPPPSLAADLLARLGDASDGGDVTIVVEGERIGAHAFVLCARSEVFARELTGPMRESTSREVTIEECDAVAFRALLYFLYSDDLERVDEWIKEKALSQHPAPPPAEADNGAASNAARAALSEQHAQAGRIALLQRGLAASHRCV